MKDDENTLKRRKYSFEKLDTNIIPDQIAVPQKIEGVKCDQRLFQTEVFPKVASEDA